MPDRKKIEKAWRTCKSGKDPCSKCHYVNERNCSLAMVADALQLLDEQPDIVRCKDCKWWYFADNRIPCEQENVCGRNGIVVTPDWFCADGERSVK